MSLTQSFRHLRNMDLEEVPNLYAMTMFIDLFFIFISLSVDRSFQSSAVLKTPLVSSFHCHFLVNPWPSSEQLQLFYDTKTHGNVDFITPSVNTFRHKRHKHMSPDYVLGGQANVTTADSTITYIIINIRRKSDLW